MDVEDLDVVLTSLVQDLDEAEARVTDDTAAARSTEARLDDLASRVAALTELIPVQLTLPASEADLPQDTVTRADLRPARDWAGIRAEAEMRLAERGVDLAQVSLDALLDPEEVERIERRFRGGFSITTRLDGYDVAAAATAGLVAALVDFFIVRIPKDIVYLGEHVQKGSPLTRWLHSLEVPSDNWLARRFKVPYDKVVEVAGEIPGMSGRSHRLHSVGHDPLVGLVVGTIDIIRGGLTAISREGKIIILSGTGPAQYNPFIAFVWQIMHLFSDAFTKMGLPAPGWSLLQLLQVGSFGEKERTIAELARFMYLKGYDSRHFLTMATSVAAAEVVLRGYFWIRRRLDEAYEDDATREVATAGTEKTSGHPRFQTMALAAHATAAAANAGKVAIYSGNPLAVNYAQWLRFFQATFAWMRTRLRSPSDVIQGHALANLRALERGWQAIDASDPSFPTMIVD